MRKILICDDDKDIVNALKLYLSDPDYSFYEAYDGEQAVETVDKEKIYLLLLDIIMPKMDGIKAMSLIRKKYNIPVILLTAKSEDSDIVLEKDESFAKFNYKNTSANELDISEDELMERFVKRLGISVCFLRHLVLYHLSTLNSRQCLNKS